MTISERSLQRLLDKEEIRDVMYQWSRGVARKDWDLVKSCYAEGARDNHGTVNSDVDGFLDWMRGYHQFIEQVIFYSTNLIIEFVDDDHAFVESHGISFQRHGPEARAARASFLGPEWIDREIALNIYFSGRKLDEFARTKEGWRITQRTQVYEAVRAEPATDGLKGSTDDLLVSRRDDMDALYAARERAGLSRKPRLF